MVETPSAGYLQRTGRNVRDSDGTVVFTLSQNASGGSRRTLELAANCERPCLSLTRSGDNFDGPAVLLQRFITANSIRCLRGRVFGVGVRVRRTHGGYFC